MRTLWDSAKLKFPLQEQSSEEAKKKLNQMPL